MKFGQLAAAVGLICAHTLRLPDGTVFKKGRRLSPPDVDLLLQCGMTSLWAAQLDDGDLDEDQAAAAVAAAVAGPNTQVAEATTGRCNVHAACDGLLLVAAPAVGRLNHLDPELTLATLPHLSPVRQGEMVATVKVIPFAVRGALVSAAQKLAAQGQTVDGDMIRIAPFVPRRMGLVLTVTPGLPDSISDRAAAAQRVRAERLASHIVEERRCFHDEVAVSTALRELVQAGCDPILVLGASAIVDRRDVIPSAIESAGGSVLQLGMPVDPGNLLLLGKLDSVTVIGVPGCARSLRRSGFDFVLERTCAGLPVTADALQDLGVGGLLHEVPWRPMPREKALLPPQVAAVVLAAGRSQRMGKDNKLLALLDGKPLVCHVVDALAKTAVSPIVVVTGHQSDAVRAALSGSHVRFAHNPDFADGLSTSLRVGLHQLDSTIDGALICLADMPRVRRDHLEALVGAFEPEDGREVVVPTFAGRRGNPVLWSARHFAAMRELRGDQGARELLRRLAAVTCMVPMPDDGVLLDVDTEESLAHIRRVPLDKSSGD